MVRAAGRPGGSAAPPMTLNDQGTWVVTRAVTRAVTARGLAGAGEASPAGGKARAWGLRPTERCGSCPPPSPTPRRERRRSAGAPRLAATAGASPSRGRGGADRGRHETTAAGDDQGAVRVVSAVVADTAARDDDGRGRFFVSGAE